MKKNFLTLLLFLLIFKAQTQEEFKFFEYAPRSSEKITLAQNVLVQPFIPFNDYLSVIVLWLENSSSTKVTLSLIDDKDVVIKEKDFLIPVIEKSWWGEEYFFPLDDNLRINSGREYKLVLKSQENNDLKIYTKNLLEKLQGTENYLYFPESLKPLLINNELSDYTFKLALYEGKESLPPSISNFEIIFPSYRKTKISFNSNEPIKISFNYGMQSKSTSTITLDYFISCPEGIRKCELEFDTLSGTKYFYLLTVQDFWGNASSLAGDFVTPKEEILLEENKTPSQSETNFQSLSDSSSLTSSQIKTQNQNQTQTRVESQTSKLTLKTSSNQEAQSLKNVNNSKIPEANLTKDKSKTSTPSILDNNKNNSTISEEEQIFLISNKETSLPQLSPISSFKGKFLIFLFVLALIPFIIFVKKKIKK